MEKIQQREVDRLELEIYLAEAEGRRLVIAADRLSQACLANVERIKELRKNLAAMQSVLAQL